MDKLYFKEYNHEKDLPLKDFLYEFFTNLNENYHTRYLENDKIQCYPNHTRSLGDIHAICATYYDGITREQVKEELLDFGRDLVGHYCGDINKRVYSIRQAPDREDWDQLGFGRLDEYGDPIEYKNE